MATTSTRRKNGRQRVWPSIKRVVNPGGKESWVIDLGRRLPSEPRRQRFDSEDAAKQVADRYREQFSTAGLDAFKLSARDREDASAALKVLADSGTTLEAAAKFFMSHNFPEGGERSVEEVVKDFIAFKEGRQRRREKTLRDYKGRLSRFCATFGQRPIKSITPPEIDAWIGQDAKREAVTQEGDHRVLNTFFNFARGTRDRKGKFTAKPYRLDNPMDRVPRPESVEKLPGRCLTIEETTRLLDAALKTQEEFELLPYTVLGLFCGIRTEELQKLQWRHVNVPAGLVTIEAGIAKAGFHRHVPIPENARFWLASAGIPPADDADTLIIPRGFNKRWEQVRRQAGLFKKWPKNALRHSFGSYASDKWDEAETRKRMGHRTPDILIRHYKTLVMPGTGERYFTLLPPAFKAGATLTAFIAQPAAS